MQELARVTAEAQGQQTFVLGDAVEKAHEIGAIAGGEPGRHLVADGVEDQPRPELDVTLGPTLNDLGGKRCHRQNDERHARQGQPRIDGERIAGVAPGGAKRPLHGHVDGRRLLCTLPHQGQLRVPPDSALFKEMMRQQHGRQRRRAAAIVELVYLRQPARACDGAPPCARKALEGPPASG
jgi:hypothetical protein